MRIAPDMNRFRVAVVGTGFGAFGALKALTAVNDLDITVFDIGLINPYSGQPNRIVPNAKTFKESFFTYGVNDERWGVKLDSQRLCSSHAFGGHSTVYSGAVLTPKDRDLLAWPEESRPRAEDYRSIIESITVLHDTDDLDLFFPLNPSNEDLAGIVGENEEVAVFGLSRLAVMRESETSTDNFPGSGNELTTDRIRPLQLTSLLSKIFESGNVSYHGGCYVTQMGSQSDCVRLSYQCEGRNEEESFDAVFIGAGCINTTGIIDRSIYGEGRRFYQIRMTGVAIQAFIRLAFSGPMLSRIRRRNGLPEFFLEINSSLTKNLWSHTQITVLNEQIVAAVCSKLPALLHPVIRPLSGLFYFALTTSHSDLGVPSVLECRSELDASGRMSSSIVISESQSERNPHLSKAVKRGTFTNWKSLRMIPFPFGQKLSDFFKGNRLGGWHFGGTTPMCQHPVALHECNSYGSVNGLQNVYVIDSSAFPSVPGSTVALLSAAHGHRVVRHWLSKTKVSKS
jgi:hypothetical protein